MDTDFTERFLADIRKQQEHTERIAKMSTEERAKLERERKQEASALADIVYDVTGCKQNWF